MINNENITDIYLENTNIKTFRFNTPNLKNLNFTDITFFKNIIFPNIFTIWLKLCNNLESLCLYECNCDKIISHYLFDFLQFK